MTLMLQLEWIFESGDQKWLLSRQQLGRASVCQRALAGVFLLAHRSLERFNEQGFWACFGRSIFEKANFRLISFEDKILLELATSC